MTNPTLIYSPRAVTEAAAWIPLCDGGLIGACPDTHADFLTEYLDALERRAVVTSEAVEILREVYALA